MTPLTDTEQPHESEPPDPPVVPLPPVPVLVLPVPLPVLSSFPHAVPRAQRPVKTVIAKTSDTIRMSQP